MTQQGRRRRGARPRCPARARARTVRRGGSDAQRVGPAGLEALDLARRMKTALKFISSGLLSSHVIK